MIITPQAEQQGESPLGSDSCSHSSFACIVADPPWDYKSPGQFGKTLEHRPNRDMTISKYGAGSAARYGTMTTENLCRLKIPAADNAHLYLWTTNGFMEQAHQIARAWGFVPKTILTWTKIRVSDGQPSMKMGYYYRGATEHCLFAVRGSLRLKGSPASTAIFARRLPHSQKPEEFYRLVDMQSPGPHLEMFARRKRHGWACWGNEITNDIEI